MNQRAVIALVVVAAAAGGYYWWNNRTAAQDKTGSEKIQQDLANYNPQPNVGAQTDNTSVPGGNIDFQSSQAMPLPYNM